MMKRLPLLISAVALCSASVFALPEDGENLTEWYYDGQLLAQGSSIVYYIPTGSAMTVDKFVGKCIKRAQNRDRFGIEITAMDGSSNWSATGYPTYSLTDLSEYGGSGYDNSFSLRPYGSESTCSEVITWFVGQGLYCKLTYSGSMSTSPTYKLSLQSDYEDCTTGECELVYTDDYVVYLTLTHDASIDAINNPVNNSTTGAKTIFIDGSDNVYANGGRLCYSAVAAPSQLTIYSVSGTVLFNGMVEGDGSLDVNLPSGLYIYKINNKTGKLAL